MSGQTERLGIRSGKQCFSPPVRSASMTDDLRSDARTVSHLRRGDGEEAPVAGHALEPVSAAVLEFES
jgi:hypothetical protein